VSKADKLALIREARLIAVVRTTSGDQVLPAVEALLSAGVRIIEVTMTTPGALSLIEEFADGGEGKILVGVGTVLDRETAISAVRSGAEFVVTPVLSSEVVAACTIDDVPVIAGCYTPTEILAGWQAGADMIKLFPAGIGGPDLVASILGPFPQLEIVPTGGVNLGNMAEFLRKGAIAVGVGSSLLERELLRRRDWDGLARRAASFVQEARRARQRPS
jgi:2-dehydro-3-deoxyphosphogluconate aldolase/(4S)-4-hydroxy-2-oxoglutarate aldolase